MRIAVSLVSHEDYRNGILAGIARYCQLHPGFEVVPVENPAELSSIAYDGVLANIQDETVDFFRSLEKPVVKIGARRYYGNFSSVQMDNYSAGRLGACHLMFHGHTQFGFLSIIGHDYAKERQEGFESQLTQFGSPSITLELREAEELDMASGPLVKLWLSAIKGPSAVMGSTDLMARRLIELCRQNKIEVPSEIAVLGFNNGLVECLSALPHLSSIAQERERLGYQAADLLSKRMADNSLPIEKRFVLARTVETRTSSSPYIFKDETLNRLMSHLQSAIIDQNRPIDDVFEHEADADALRLLLADKARGNDLRNEHLRFQILLAERLLRQSDMNLERIVEVCGLSDRARFDGLFALGFDMPPQAYRAQFEDEPFAPAAGIL